MQSINVFFLLIIYSFTQFQSECHQKVNAKHRPIHCHRKDQSKDQSAGKANQAKTRVKIIEKLCHQIHKHQAIERNVVVLVKNRSIIKNRIFWNLLKCIAAAIWVIKSVTTKICGHRKMGVAIQRSTKDRHCPVFAQNIDPICFLKLVSDSMSVYSRFQ